jgi:lipopolysaccharide export system protein LptA
MEDKKSMTGEEMGKKIVALVVVFSLFGIVGFSFFKKEAPKAPPPAPVQEEKAAPAAGAASGASDKDGAVNQKVLSFNLEGFTQKGTKSWEVNGQSAEAVTETQVKLDNIVAKAYGDEAEAVITADKGIYDKKKNNVTLESNVKATIDSTKGFSEQFAGLPSSSAGAAGPNDPPAAGEKKKSRIVITCSGQVEFNYEKNQAYFVKDVRVESKDGNIDADRITVNLDPTSKKVKTIVAEGNVKITQGENVTYSDKAIYVEKDKRIVLVGRPKLVIYEEGEGSNSFLGGITGDSKK